MKNTDSITTRVPPALKLECEQEAVKLGQDDLSKFVRWVLQQYFNKKEKNENND